MSDQMPRASSSSSGTSRGRSIVFAVARVRQRSRTVFGSSDFKVIGNRPGRRQAEPEGAGRSSRATSPALATRGHDSLVSGGYDGQLIWWDIAKTGQDPRSRRAHEVDPPGGGHAATATFVASVADDMVCRVWDAATGEMLHELRGHEELTPHHFPSMLYAWRFSPDGRHLATGDKVGHIVVWDARIRPARLTTLEAPVMYTWDPVQRRHSIGGIRSLAFSPDGKQLAVGGIGKIGNIDHLEGKAASRSSTGKPANARTSSSATSSRASSIDCASTQRATGSWPSAEPTTASCSSST